MEYPAKKVGLHNVVGEIVGQLMGLGDARCFAVLRAAALCASLYFTWMFTAESSSLLAYTDASDFVWAAAVATITGWLALPYMGKRAQSIFLRASLFVYAALFCAGLYYGFENYCFLREVTQAAGEVQDGEGLRLAIWRLLSVMPGSGFFVYFYAVNGLLKLTVRMLRGM
jgi:hypothetical protein